MECCRIYLTLLENLHFSTLNGDKMMDPGVFVLEFKDGKHISFSVSTGDHDGNEYIQNERNLWVNSIEESHFLLRENQVPDWTSLLEI